MRKVLFGGGLVLCVWLLWNSSQHTTAVFNKQAVAPAFDSLLKEIADLRTRLEAAETLLADSGVLDGVSKGAVQRFATRQPPQPLPGLLLEGETGHDPRDRTIYGGKGDAVHLGGFTKNDTAGQSPALWTWMMKTLNVRSILDIGCGRGISTRWFKDHGAQVLCVEGSNDAIKQTLLDSEDIVNHDFSRGPWWSTDTFDIVWAVEFLEHVGRYGVENCIVLT